MSQLQTIPFQFQKNQLNVIQINQEPWFIAKDLTEILGYRDNFNALRILEDEEKGTHLVRTPGGLQEASIINESGLYSLILRSKKSEAKQFKKWVTSEVLPAIRKHGGYLTPSKTEELLNNPDLIIEMATKLKMERTKNDQLVQMVDQRNEIIDLQANQLKQVSPAVEYYTKVLNAEDTVSTNIIAKELGMSAKTLNKILHEEYNIIYKQGGVWMPYAKYQGMGLHRTKTYTYTRSDGSIGTEISMVWTQTGRRFIHGLFNARKK